MGKAVEITTENFTSQVEGATGVQVVDFGATWCGPCQALAPTIEELAADYASKGVMVGKCDVDQASELAAKFGIMSVPTIIFFKDGAKVDTIMGNQPKAKLAAKIDALLGG
ncbi:MAG: thioredoxin [Planctomycetes bacterium]|nr:thioredoxin [Planctomycetota bacterium]